MRPIPLPRPADRALAARLESILLVAGGPVSIAHLARCVQEPESTVREALAVLADALTLGIRVQVHAGQAQLVSAPEHVDDIHRFLGTARPPALSRATLETLTVIAYKQPATRAEIEAIRGVNSDRAVQTLLARALVEEVGKRQTPGHPSEYATTFGFLEYFGLSSLDELPPLEESEMPDIDSVTLGLRTQAAGGNVEEDGLA
jgi:segregation and condensation protein B